ncbi:MAG TPA: hypothetical protein VM282_26705 [Acidimicrobiales bacterium]|nr:hypothetical protein [Acidimicrobiales bacterium]
MPTTTALVALRVFVCLGLVGLAAGVSSHAASAAPVLMQVTQPVAETVTGTLVQTIRTSGFHPSSPDPSGVVYQADLDRLMISDSEVDETTGAGYHGVNLWQLSRTGTLIDTGTTFPAYSREPSGLGYDSVSRALFISDDTADRVWVVKAGADQRFGTPDDLVTFVDARAYGSYDTEDPEFDTTIGQPTSGHLFFLDGTGTEIYDIDPVDGIFGNGNDIMTHFDIGHLGPIDFEGLGSDPSTNTLYVGARTTKQVFEITKTGALVRTIDLTGIPGLRFISGLALAPASDNSSRLNLWVVDRGVDNEDDPNENDGRLFEIAFAGPAGVDLPASIPDTYFPLRNPIRVFDSRPVGSIPTGSSRTVKVAGVAVNGISVPPEATSVIANITAVDPDQAGFLTVYPWGQAIPMETSTHNFAKGENFANTVVMAVGAGGHISVLNKFYSGAGATHVLVDIIGYSTAEEAGSRLRSIAPVRALDSRNAIGGPSEPFHARAPRDLAIVGQPGIPTNVQAVVLNMTFANATNTGSFVTVWPKGEAQPNISVLNVVAGIARANLIVARVGANGMISIVNDSGQTDLLADIVGYFEPSGTGGSITGKNPTREFNTRFTTPFQPGETRQITIQGQPGMPGPPGIPPAAKTAILKITAVDPTANGGYLTVWPTGAGTTPPNVSNLNFNAAMNIPNLVITQIGSDGTINIHNAFGVTHVLIDVLGYAD